MRVLCSPGIPAAWRFQGQEGCVSASPALLATDEPKRPPHATAGAVLPPQAELGSPALAFVKAVAEVLALETGAADEVALLRRNALALVGCRPFSSAAQFKVPATTRGRNQKIGALLINAFSDVGSKWDTLNVRFRALHKPESCLTARFCPDSARIGPNWTRRRFPT